MRMTIPVLALAALSACAPSIPESGAGVGFQDYDGYLKEKQARDAKLAGNPLPPADAVSEETLGDGFVPVNRVAPAPTPTPAASSVSPSAADGSDVAADVEAMLEETANNSGEPVLHASPSNPPPEAVLGPIGISKENDFTAVGAQRSIASDKEMIARNRAQYKVIQPTALPSRSGNSEPNIVAYALQTKHAPGTPLYHRIGLNKTARAARNCAKYPSPDRAQEDFMARGGPEHDRLGLDPDGDGFACSWDPRPFRKAVHG